jgi:hypothetical protein
MKSSTLAKAYGINVVVLGTYWGIFWEHIGNTLGTKKIPPPLEPKEKN